MNASTPIIVGTFTITEPTVMVEHYETASWEKRVEVHPGIYPVIAYCSYKDGHPDMGHSLYIKANGKIVGGYMASRGFGYTGPNEMARRVGEASDASRTIGRSFPTHATPEPYTAVQKFGHQCFIDGVWTDTRTFDGWETVPVESLELPEGLALDMDKVFVRFVTESGGIKRGNIQITREAYNAARRCSNSD